MTEARERLPIFQAAADAYRWPAELEAVMQQALGPQWMTWVLVAIDSAARVRFGLALDEDGLGDAGHGHGEMQIDDRSHAAFVLREGWQDLADLPGICPQERDRPVLQLPGRELFRVCSGKTTPPFSGVLLPPTTAAPEMFARPWKRDRTLMPGPPAKIIQRT